MFLKFIFILDEISAPKNNYYKLWTIYESENKETEFYPAYIDYASLDLFVQIKSKAIFWLISFKIE